MKLIVTKNGNQVEHPIKNYFHVPGGIVAIMRNSIGIGVEEIMLVSQDEQLFLDLRWGFLEDDDTYCYLFEKV